MVLTLRAALDQLHAAAGVARGFGEDFEEERLGHVVGAGAGDEVAARFEHLERAQVDLLVAARGRGDARAVLGEGRRVEDDGVEALARRLQRVQRVASASAKPP